MSIARILRHLCTPSRAWRRAFSQDDLAAVEAATRKGEKRHHAEIRFAVEAALDVRALTRGLSPRDRALEVFSDLRVWDTAENSGVLVYLLLADRDVEIVADRGIARRVAAAEWESICRLMESAFRAGRFRAGACDGIRAIHDLLAREFPATGANPNELSDRPAIVE